MVEPLFKRRIREELKIMYTKLWLDDVKDDNGCLITFDGVDGKSRVIDNAVRELKTVSCLNKLNITLARSDDKELGDEGYRISAEEGKYRIEALTDTGLIYGSFRFINLYRISSDKVINAREVPTSMFRMLNHWDNMDGSIERGYSG